MEIAMNLVGNATFTITIDNTVKFAIDPALDVEGSPLGFGIYRKKGPVYNENTFEDIDFWLLTHAHLDHIDAPGVKVIEENTPIIAAPSCQKTLQKFNINNNHVEYLDWQEQIRFEKGDYTVDIIAIPAYHGYGKLVVKLMTRVNGYVLRIKKGSNEKVMYITSDTVYNQQVVAALKGVQADILIANLGEAKAPLPVTRKPITMDLQSLQQFAQLTKAKFVLPLHIDDYSHFQTNKKQVEAVYPTLDNGKIKVFYI